MTLRTTNETSERTPADLRPIEARLEALGGSERSGAPGALEDRLFLATRARLRAGAPAPAPLRVSGVRWVTPLRLAAALGLSAGAALLASSFARPGAPAPGPVAVVPPVDEASVDIEGVRSDLSAFLASLESDDDTMVSLSSDLASTEEGLESFWSAGDLAVDRSEDSL